MKQFVDDFKVNLENLMDDWYHSLENLVDGALFNMSFFEGEPEEHYELLQNVMIEVLQERLGDVLGEDGESE